MASASCPGLWGPCCPLQASPCPCPWHAPSQPPHGSHITEHLGLCPPRGCWRGSHIISALSGPQTHTVAPAPCPEPRLPALSSLCPQTHPTQPCPHPQQGLPLSHRPDNTSRDPDTLHTAHLMSLSDHEPCDGEDQAVLCPTPTWGQCHR